LFLTIIEYFKNHFKFNVSLIPSIQERKMTATFTSSIHGGQITVSVLKPDEGDYG
jgi:hypothetical protein